MDRLKKIVFSVFPRPRRPVTVRQAGPLIVFLLLYAALIVWLEWSGRMLFGRPAMFALIAVAPWVWWMHVAGYSGLGSVRGQVVLLTRLLLVGVFVMLLAEPRAVRTRDTLSVIYALDISDSIGDGSSDAALQFVTRTAWQKPPRDEAGLIVFGGNAAVELPPRMSFPLAADEVEINSRIDRDATNLEQALSLAAAMLSEETLGRIVLISDGEATDGSLSRVLDELKAREIAVDVLPIAYNYDYEVWLERLELPQFVKLGETYDAVVLLSSLQPGQGRLVLRENGRAVFEDEVEFQAGKNRYVLPIRLREPGYYEYAATIEVPDGRDHITDNNTVMNYLFVEGEGQILVVTDPDGDPRDWESLVRAIRESERIAEVRSAYDFPHDALSLMPYDAIIFANVPADAFDARQLQAVRDAAYELGTGFLMVGGQHSFGPGGYHRTPVEEALPVTMDISKKKVLPKGALAIILHTCEFPEGNTWAKRITAQAIKVLGAQDEVGVLLYDWQAGDRWLFELTPAGDYEKLVPKINAAEPGDMPAFGPSMQMGFDGLKKSDAATKHMIIISDGDPQPPSGALLRQFRDEQISVSTVSIYPHGGLEIQLMQQIAQFTAGRYYASVDPDQLPSIFIKEAKTLKRGMVHNKTFTPEFGLPTPVLRGIDAVPPLHGYVLTTAKPRAEVALQTLEEDEIDPVLAFGRHGLGRTAAFTSDLSPNWGADWVAWEQYRAFVQQLMIDVSRVRKEGHLRLWTYTSGNEGVIVVEDYHPQATFLDLAARVSGPRERAETLPLKQVGPRRYQASVPLWGRGRYQAVVEPIGGERSDERVLGGFILPYSPEFLRFRSNPIVLNEIAGHTGGMVLNGDSTTDDIYGTRRQSRRSSWPVFDWFLIALACLVPLDVAVRRIQIDWALMGNWLALGRRRGPSTETMGALLQRKQAVESALNTQREERPPPPQTAARPVVSAAAPRPAPPLPKPQEPLPPPDAREQDASTTSRLLAMKRRRQSDGEEGG